MKRPYTASFEHARGVNEVQFLHPLPLKDNLNAEKELFWEVSANITVMPIGPELTKTISMTKRIYLFIC